MCRIYTAFMPTGDSGYVAWHTSPCQPLIRHIVDTCTNDMQVILLSKSCWLTKPRWKIAKHHNRNMAKKTNSQWRTTDIQCRDCRRFLCLVRWHLHDISTDDLWWAYSIVLALVLCRSARWSNWAHMLLRSQCTSVTWSCVAQCIASSADDVLWAESLSQQPHMQQVSPSCACIEFCTSERCTYFQATSVIRLVCRVRWSSGCWAWICNSLHQVMISDQHTQLCLHWCNACLSTVVEVGTCAAVVPMHNSHKVCIITWSVDWLCAAYSWSTHVTMLSQSSAPNAASVTHLCLHWCSAHLSARL